MRAPRLSLRLAATAALAGLLVATGWTAAKRPHATTGSVNHVEITSLLNDYDTNFCPYDLVVDYTAAQAGLEVAIAYSGNAVSPKPAPQPNDTLTFQLSFQKDTTDELVTAKLRVAGASPEDVKDADSRLGLTFICGGMEFRFDGLPERAKPTAKPGYVDIPAGPHYDRFPPYDAVLPGATARVLIQGRPVGGGPLKPVYDLPADLLWLPQGGKWHPVWFLRTTEPLNAGDPKKFLTLMRPVLLDSKGKVLHIMTHKY
jgi:hypothetical protein